MKRRFSSGDLSSELDGEGEPGAGGYPPDQPGGPAPPGPGGPGGPGGAPRPGAAPAPAPGAGPAPAGAAGAGAPQSGDLSLNLKPNSRTTSAPSSPAKTRESLLQRVQSLTGVAKEHGSQILGSVQSAATAVRPSFNKDRCFTLLVIDDQNTD
ncbi:hypothetical protein FOCC_FOCC013002, partial [Frankliniella occidentalis]